MGETLITLVLSWAPFFLLLFLFVAFTSSVGKRAQKTMSIMGEQQKLLERLAKATERIATSLEQLQNQKRGF